jgi:hypothetical protein
MYQELLKAQNTIRLLRETCSVGGSTMLEIHVGRLEGQMGVLLRTLGDLVDAMVAAESARSDATQENGG